MTDAYRTLAAPAEAVYTERRSRFIAYAIPVGSEEEVKVNVQALRKKYYDARHVCYAYALGYDGERTRAVDDGEPSGTGGKPILGRIRNAGLTFTLVAVVRYFGGIQLGAANLGTAYKTAAAAALENASTAERVIKAEIRTAVPYPDADAAMRIARDEGADIAAFDCGPTEERITFAIRRGAADSLRKKLQEIYPLRILDDEPELTGSRPPQD